MASGRSVFALAALWCVHATAHAQDDEAEGRRLLELAVHARDEGRLEEARELLVQSLERHRWSYPAFELGNVLAAMGRPVEAVTTYEDLLGGAYGEVTGEARTNIEAALGTTRPRIARIALSWRGARDAIVRLDGVVVPNDDGATALSLSVDPGRHIVAIEAGTRRIERTVDVSAGDTAPLEIDLAPAPIRVEPDPIITLPPDEDDEGISPWFWVVISIVAVGAGAAVLGIVLATGGPPIDDIGT